MLMLTKVQVTRMASLFREIASVLDNTSAEPVENKTVSKRGRKPGTVSDEDRCAHLTDETNNVRCKNRATQGTVCGKHKN